MRVLRERERSAEARAGFTILEILLAMGILVLGATALIGMLTFGAALTRTAQLRTAAAASMDAVSADLDHNLFPFEDGVVLAPVELIDRQVPDAPGVVYSAKAEPNPENPREYRVDVQMSWQSAGVRKWKRFQVLKLREIAFGERLRRQLVEDQPAFSDSTNGTR